MKKLSRRIEWLSLIEVSGPFLAVSLLEKAFPQGLEAVETPRRQQLRAAYGEWCDAIDEFDPALAELHREWIRQVLVELLEYEDSVLIANDDLGEPCVYRSPEHGATFAPDLVVRGDGDERPRLLISVQPPGTDLEKVKTNDGWPVCFMERMVLLCRSTAVRLGLLTDGERWMLVNAPVGETSSYASWYARLWFQEPVTLKAFQSLLGVRRCFGPSEETLNALLEESLEHQEEVTDTLGEQVRRAVEVLVQSLDKADEDRNRELLRDVHPTELYEAGLTVMMRLVFILCAEERGLLLLDDPVYDQCYAISTLRGQLAEEADRHGPEVLERRHDAWARLLTVFRAVYGGIEHESLRMPALGGSLFDPDRFPFLEGRAKYTHWRETTASPLPIDNRTVLLLLDALQVLEQSSGALLLSYRALDVEQIGHVYEGLLEHTVARAPEATLGLVGSKKAKSPNLTLAEMESARMASEKSLLGLIAEATQRSVSAIKSALKKDFEEDAFFRLLLVCGGDIDLANRIRPFANLLRTDAWDEQIVYRAHSFMVTLGADRRETGTHYTPKSLTETIVANTLEPVAYVGPCEGMPREAWQLKSSAELLNLRICDPAMGSGAFLVQVCRWLAERVVEAWSAEEASGKVVTIDGALRDCLGDDELISSSLDLRIVIARRLVAGQCIYGVDINPLAVELAKLSMWLVTLAKGYPFGFLDHNLCSGDSLLGIHHLDQLFSLSLQPDEKNHVLPLFEQLIARPVEEAVRTRREFRGKPIRDICDVREMAVLNCQVNETLRTVEDVANALIGEVLRANGRSRELDDTLKKLSANAIEALNGNNTIAQQLAKNAKSALSIDLPVNGASRRAFHWPLAFPEVFWGSNPGFDAILGNPPFMGGRNIAKQLGRHYFDYLGYVRSFVKGSPDLCAYFILRSYALLAPNANLGMLATKTISETGTRAVCLDQLVEKGAHIYKAFTRFTWPGKASVVASIINLRRGSWNGTCIIDGVLVGGITGGLEDDSLAGKPFRLKSMKGCFGQGQCLMDNGGFQLTNDEREYYLSLDPRNDAIIQPLFNGKDVNQLCKFDPYRWVINFRQMNESEARTYVHLFEHVTNSVKDYRDSLNGQIHEKRHWLFWDYRKRLVEEINKRERIVVSSRKTKFIVFRVAPTNVVFTENVKIFLFSEPWQFAAIQSTLHQEWAAWRGGTIGASTFAYSTSECLETWPMPPSVQDSLSERLNTIGRDYSMHQQAVMEGRNVGLTDCYNLFHDPNEHDPSVQVLRDTQVIMDCRVLSSYGWDDLSLEHDFYQTRNGIRLTISEGARLEVLRRLLRLNLSRYKEEAT